MTIWSAEIKELEVITKSFSGQLPELKKELEELLKAENENVVLLYSRRCLEVIVNDLCKIELNRPRKIEPLKGIIDKLYKEEKVPPHIITSMLNLNSLSVYGAHPKEYDPQQVRPVLINLTTIIQWYLKSNDTRPSGKMIEQEKDDNNVREDSKETAQKTNKGLIIFLSALTLVAVIVVALFVFNIIGGGKQNEELEKSIAVIPFINDSPDEANNYFINGIMDEVLINLQSIKDLTVVSRNSVEQYRGPNKPPTPEIARELNVNYIVEGSCQKYGNTFRLRVQLINAPEDRHIWGDSYEKEIEATNDIFSIQTQIAESIAAELKVIITPEEKQLIDKEPTKNLEAYDYYLLGKNYYNNFTHDEDLWKSIEYFQLAIAIDTSYAMAYSGLAEAYMQLFNAGILPPMEAYPKIKTYSTKALELDEELANTHTILGRVKQDFEYDFTGAEQEYIRALKNNPNSADAHSYYAAYLSVIGKHNEALSHSDIAINLDPLSIHAKASKYLNLFYAGKKIEALKLMQEARDLDSVYPYWHYYCAVVYINLEKYNEALTMLQIQIKLMGNDNISDELGLLGYAYAQLGQKEEAQKQLLQLDELSSRGLYVPPRARVTVHMGLGNTDKALEIIEKALEEHSIRLYIFRYLEHDPLLNNPRYIELMESAED